MNKKSLSRLAWLPSEVTQLEARIVELMREYITTAAQQGASRLTWIRMEIIQLDASITKTMKEHTDGLAWIESIADPFLRMIFRLRCIEGRSWGSVAFRIGGNTPDSVRMAHNRYLGIELDDDEDDYLRA